MDYGKRPPLDEQKALFEATIAAEGVTTVAGEATGLSLTDAGLAGSGLNSFVSMMAVIHPGEAGVDSRDITAFDNGTGEVTVAPAFKGGQVAAGVRYKIVTFRFVPAEVAALTALVVLLMADVGDPTGETLPSLATKWGDIARSLDLILGARWDAAGDLGTDIATLLAAVSGQVVGRAQIAATTIDLNQGIATYPLFTGATQDVVIEGLTIRTPDIVCGGALTSISIQTDDTTAQIFITAAEGAVANLTAEAQLSWAPASGITLLKDGKIIGLTIAGGAHGVAYVCDVIVKYRAVVSGGNLT